MARSVFRNQVIGFAASPFGEQTAGPIAFHPRPQLSRENVILPEQTFAAIEDHVFGIAEHRERLRESGQHLKRGLLLHGPPGTGKTLTTRYLIGRLTDHTDVVLSGAALRYIEAAASLARSLQPALVVLEDVDLGLVHQGARPQGGAGRRRGSGRHRTPDSRRRARRAGPGHLARRGGGLTRALLGITRETTSEQDAAQPPPSAAGWFAYAPLGRPQGTARAFRIP
ncbi:MAG: AAA family ATPase [Solirubrobacteraceae bacterium]